MSGTSINSKLAIFCVLGGMMALGITDNFMPHITQTGSLWQFHMVRGVLGVGLLMGIAALGFGMIRPKRWWAVLGRSLFPATAMLIYFGCLSVLPIGVVVAGLFTAPLFVLLISVLFQGKQVGMYRWAAVVVGFAGALLVIRPDPAALDLVAFLPIVAGIFYAIGAVATRAWCEGESTISLTAGFFAILSIFGALGVWVMGAGGPAGHEGFVLRGWVALTPTMWMWIWIQAVGSLIGIGLIFRAYLEGEAGHVAVYEYSLLVFASFWAWVMWGQTVDIIAVVGMVLIAVAGAIISLRTDEPMPVRGVDVPE